MGQLDTTNLILKKSELNLERLGEKTFRYLDRTYPNPSYTLAQMDLDEIYNGVVKVFKRLLVHEENVNKIDKQTTLEIIHTHNTTSVVSSYTRTHLKLKLYSADGCEEAKLIIDGGVRLTDISTVYFMVLRFFGIKSHF